MKRLGLVILLFIGMNAFSQGADSLLQGRWELFQIIDNMTGETITPTHKTTEEFVYFITFNHNIVKYNLEVNKCENEITVRKDRSIEFKYFAQCTEICCDAEFSNLLTYTECNKYYIKSSKVLVMVSEDRIFYFNRANK